MTSSPCFYSSSSFSSSSSSYSFTSSSSSSSFSFSCEQVLSQMHHFEIKRQELLKELIHTERTHLKKLLIMKHVRIRVWVGHMLVT